MDTLVLNNRTHVPMWYILDATDKVLGRLASVVATHLIGKNRVGFDQSADTSDFIIVINIDKLRVTGKKYKEKIYYRHSGYPGGLKKTAYCKVFIESPDKVFLSSVKGMLPKNRLLQSRLNKLKVYVGDKHPHNAQTPITL